MWRCVGNFMFLKHHNYSPNRILFALYYATIITRISQKIYYGSCILDITLCMLRRTAHEEYVIEICSWQLYYIGINCADLWDKGPKTFFLNRDTIQPYYWRTTYKKLCSIEIGGFFWKIGWCIRNSCQLFFKVDLHTTAAI